MSTTTVTVGDPQGDIELGDRKGQVTLQGEMDDSEDDKSGFSRKAGRI